jgi:hypothetical protein
VSPPEGLAPKRPPTWTKWQYLGYLAGGAGVVQHAWSLDRMLVLSSLIWAEFHGEPRWQWLVTVSARGAQGQRRRPTDEELLRPLRNFGMEKAEEDNHQPGVSRGFFLLCEARAEDKEVGAEQRRAEMEALHHAARSRG